MPDIARSVGSPVTIELDGETCILEPLGLYDFGTIENHLLREKRKAILQAFADSYESIPPELRDQMRTSAENRAYGLTTIGANEVAEWIDTPTGLAYTIWLAFERKYPGKFTLRRVSEYIQSLAVENRAEFDSIRAARDEASFPAKKKTKGKADLASTRGRPTS